MSKRRAKHKYKQSVGISRIYVSGEFEADTIEDRPVALLAEKHRRFLVGLKA